MTMFLYHGTNRHNLKGIVEDGRINGPVFLSDCLEVARYFAKTQHRKNQSDWVILKVAVDSTDMQPDYMSLLDPIKIVQQRLGIKDEMAYLEDLAKFDDERWIEMLGERAGRTEKSHWKLSLALANAVIYPRSIPLRDIQMIN